MEINATPPPHASHLYIVYMTHNGCDVRTHFLADTADRLIAIIISGVLCHLKCYFSVPTKCKYMYDLITEKC